MKAKYVIGGLIIVLFMVWGATAFMKTTIQYVPIEKARTSTRMVQVMGKIDFDQVNFNVDQSRLEFTVYDSEAADKTTAEQLKVVYYGVVPGNFDQATSVVLKGKTDGEFFVADQMLVKCPSKYQGEEGDGYQDMRKHDEATPKPGA
ncbi:MAG: cytochrome c maturation protein CcmE [candidate division Zixibacteria bacterium]|nr:cytochrome c maturation protein CcmE [candidate division Zixibacteria bacterium]